MDIVVLYGILHRGINMVNNVNKMLRVTFIFSSFVLLALLIGAPKTHCQACFLEYEGSDYDGYEAFEYFEDECISYRKPWDTNYDPFPNLTDSWKEELHESVNYDNFNYTNVLEGQ